MKTTFGFSLSAVPEEVEDEEEDEDEDDDLVDVAEDKEDEEDGEDAAAGCLVGLAVGREGSVLLTTVVVAVGLLSSAPASDARDTDVKSTRMPSLSCLRTA